MLPSIRIRGATPADAAGIAAVHVASWRTTYAGIIAPETLDALSIAERRATWLERLHRPELVTLVAEQSDGGILGFASGGAIRDPQPVFDAELYAIYLLRESRGAGIGRRLAGAWAARSVERGFRAAVVRVLARNPACGFYERLGARLLSQGEHTVGGRSYPDCWYGWDDLRALASFDDGARP